MSYEHFYNDFINISTSTGIPTTRTAVSYLRSVRGE